MNWGADSDLAPFVSFVVLEKPRNLSLSKLADQLRSFLAESEHRVELSELAAVSGTGRKRTFRFHYVEKRRPPWLTKGSGTPIVDTTHHLVLLYAAHGLVAVHCSETQACNEIVRAARKSRRGFPPIEPVRPAALETALAWGRARTLWLGTVQRRSGQRADAKVLSGSDLTYALDPLEDQGYAFSSARCDHGDEIEKNIVGVSPPRARIWTGPAGDVASYIEAADALLATISVPQRHRATFRDVLATRASARTVERAFEVAVIHPDLDEGATQDTERERAVRRVWAEEADLVVSPTQGAAFSLSVAGLPTPCILQGKLDDDDLHITCVDGHTADTDPCAEARRVLNNHDWTSVRYGSGHAWISGELFEMRLRPVDFHPAFVPIDGKAIDICEEKPREAQRSKSGMPQPRDSKGRLALSPTLSPSRLESDQPSDGRSKRSLFNWIVHERPQAIAPPAGWLACDDGAGERADFVYVEPTSREVRLIHVKACHSSGNRVSLLDFEQAVAQAIKNLRWLNINELAGLMSEPSANVASLVWPSRGDPPLRGDKRKKFADVLSALGDDYTRRVVVVQPALAESAWAAAAQQTPPDARQLLSTLLWSARATCQGLNATFEVVGRE